MASSGGESIKFSVVVRMLESMQRSKRKKKQTFFRKFLDSYCGKPEDYFASMRLILPGLDRDRGSYGLKEQVLATCIIDAIGMSRDSDDARLLLNWRKAGPRAGLNAGNFSLIAAEVLERRQGVSSAGLTIKELNHFLDSLASSANRSEKTAVLSDLIRRTNANEMKWILMIILKDLKVGISEKSIFHEFHLDAEDLFNVTCDLKLVCEKLRDRSQRHKRQDIEVGKAVRPQLALRANTADVAWKRLRGKEFVLECKFDGDRIQIHKNKDEIHFFSRNFFDHQEYIHGMSEIIVQNILVEKCILDGEMLVWDRSANRFAEFGSNQEIAKAAREGLDSDRQLCYVAFDVLYAGDTSVIHQSLKERHELLRKVVKPVKGSLEILVPNGGLNVHRAPGEPCWSFIGHSLDDIEKFFKATTENRDEGIVLKDLNSKWDPGDRKGNWQKMKPDYVRPGTDLDVLIIGGYYGSGRHGGKVAQFLVGLSERPSPGTCPRRFISFCRVGTGLSDEELDAVVTRLKPYFRKYEFPKQTPPSFYQVTNNSRERPDVWVESPEKSIILSITSDIRTIRSEAFAAPYSLRFPRIDCVRYDKPWHDCLDVQSFVELVHSSNGTTQRGTNSGGAKGPGSKHIKLKSRERKNASLVPSHFVQTDVSQIKGETSIFSNMVFYFANVPTSHSLDFLHKMIVEHGGTFSMNLNNSVTHCIAAESRGIKFQAAKLQGDVIHCSWLFDCCSQKRLLPLLPKYFIFLSDSMKKKLQEEVDKFSDSYYISLKMDDFRQLMNSVSHSEESKVIEIYKKKYCPGDKWCCFHDCCIHFFLHTHSLNGSQQKVFLELAMRRLKVEVTMGGGKFSDTILQATHLVIISLPVLCLNFDMLLRSFSAADRHVLCSNKLHIVSSQWLEDCCEINQKLPEDSYSLKPMNFEAYVMKERKDESTLDDNTVKHFSPAPAFEDELEEKIASLHESTTSMPPKRDSKRKQRPRGITASTRREATIKQPRRAKFGSKPARISMNETSESDDSSGGISQKHEFGGSDKEENCDFDMHIDDNRIPMIDRNETKTRQRLTVKQPRRANVRNKLAKINENETTESDDSLVGISQIHEFGRGDKEETCDFDMHNDESRKPNIDRNKTTRRKHTVKQPRAKVGSKSAKINENETNESDSASVGISQTHEFGMSYKEENREFDMHNDEIIHKSRPEIPLRREIDDSKLLTEGKEIKESLDLSSDGKEWNVSRTYDHNTHHDPFQSILQPNMLPCHEKKPSSSATPFECENQVPSLYTKPNSMDVDTLENPQIDLTPNPSKKKKVSFRSLAAELLKDW